MARSRTALNLVTCSLTSVLLAVGFPPQPLGFLAWIALAPLYAVLTLDRPGSKRSLLYGWIGGLGIGVVGVYWLIGTVIDFVHLPWPAAVVVWLGFSAYEALPFGAWALALRFGPRTGWPRVLFASLAFPAIEHAFPTAFNFHCAVSLAPFPAWIQLAEWGGPALVVWPMAVTGIALGHALVQPQHYRAWLVVTVGVPALVAAHGWWRLTAVDTEQAGAPTVRVGIVQPNVPLFWDDKETHMAALNRASAEAAQDGAQVIVWPESAYPWGIRLPWEHDFAADNDPIRGGHRRSFIFATTTYRDNAPWPSNTAYLIEPDGVVGGIFTKVHLIPFGENIPLVDPKWAIDTFSGLEQFVAGDGPARFVAPTPGRPETPTVFGPMICYEDNIPSFGRAVAAQAGGVHAFVNLTNDTWFGPTWEPWEHQGLAIFRTIEHRIPMVRSVNTGVSAVIDTGGRVLAHTHVHATAARPSPETLVVDMPLPRNTAERPTPFARGGWLAPWAMLGGCVAWVLGLARRRRPG